MRSRFRRRVRRPPDLTSLFDVLFIVVFVALIRAAAADQAIAAMKPKPIAEPPRPPPAVAALKARALASITADLAKRTPLVVRVSQAGVVTMLEVTDKQVPLDVPLLEQNADPNVQATYLGDRSAELRICRIAAVHLGEADLARYLVIISPDAPLRSRQVALNEGLERDLGRCTSDQNGTATIVEPEVTP